MSRTMGKYDFGFRVALLVLCALCEASIAFFPCTDEKTSARTSDLCIVKGKKGKLVLQRGELGYRQDRLKGQDWFPASKKHKRKSSSSRAGACPQKPHANPSSCTVSVRRSRAPPQTHFLHGCKRCFQLIVTFVSVCFCSEALKKKTLWYLALCSAMKAPM